MEVVDKKLWEKCKKQQEDGKRWDARKSQRAVKCYKKAGGRYKTKKKKGNSLDKWTKEDWCYGPYDRNKTGRYLPRAVWKQLTREQALLTNRNKRKGTGNVPWEDFIYAAAKKAGVKLGKVIT